MEQYYFLKSVMSKDRNRLRALASQKFPDGSEVDQTYNIASDRVIRSNYPIGTIFGTTSLVSSGGYYTSGDLFVMGIRPDEYKSEAHKPSEEMQRAYERYTGVFSDATIDESDFKDAPEDKKKTKTHKVSYLSKMMKNSELSTPSIEKDGFYVDSKDWYLLLRNIQNQINTMMIGATGSGKTELVILACKKLGIECNVYDMGSMYDPVAGLLGVHRISEEGSSIFDYAKFTEDIKKPGVVLLDELSRAPVTTNNILFPCLDSRRKLPVEIAGGKDLRSVEVNPDCCFIATANVGSEYTGTNSMDRALVNRFFPLELTYMPEVAEVDVLVKRTAISKSDAKMIVNIAQQVRNLFMKQELSCSLSTRETLMVSNLVHDGWNLLEAMELVFLPLFEGTNVEGERSMVRKLFASR